MNEYIRGLKAGIPIGLGYLSVAFTFGIMSVVHGLYWWQAAIISLTVLTSAGQLAAIQIMPLPGQYLNLFISQATINIRYSFMSISLSQKLDSNFKGIYKWLLGFFITDEIFAALIQQHNNVKRIFMLGVVTLPYFGWAIGTIGGALLGSVLPTVLLNALSIAIYGMFIAIIIPCVKKSSKTLKVVIFSIVLSLLFYFVPGLNQISSGLSVSICAILAATLGAILFPIKEGDANGC